MRIFYTCNWNGKCLVVSVGDISGALLGFDWWELVQKKKEMHVRVHKVVFFITPTY